MKKVAPVRRQKKEEKVTYMNEQAQGTISHLNYKLLKKDFDARAFYLN